ARMVPMRVVPQGVRHLGRMHNSRLVAKTPGYAEVNKLEMASGRFLNQDDDQHMKNVAVLAHGTALALFPFEDALGQTVHLYQHRYVIVGVVRKRNPTGGSGGSQAAEDFNDDVYIPLQT